MYIIYFLLIAVVFYTIIFRLSPLIFLDFLGVDSFASFISRCIYPSRFSGSIRVARVHKCEAHKYFNGPRESLTPTQACRSRPLSPHDAPPNFTHSRPSAAKNGQAWVSWQRRDYFFILLGIEKKKRQESGTNSVNSTQSSTHGVTDA